MSNLAHGPLHERLMSGLSVQHLRFKVQATEAIVFEDQPGSALRGALYQVLADNFCSEAFGMLTPDHTARCPVCWLLAAEDLQARRGRNIPRPLTVEPPLEKAAYRRDQEITFGFSLIGQAQDMLPYLARAVEKMGRIGVGRGRGRFTLLNIAEYNPLLDAERTLLDGRIVKKPTLQVTAARVTEVIAQLSREAITLELLTPVRLTAEQHLVKTADPRIFVQRLIERCQNLVEQYAEYGAESTNHRPTRADWVAVADALSQDAARLSIVYDDTQWAEARSGSRRLHRSTPISGLVGRVRWKGSLDTLLPWILWGQSLHVGKNAVKGNGWYRVVL